jgi:excisionase family DNA binding protein
MSGSADPQAEGALTVSQIAGMLNASKYTVRELLKSGKLKGFKLLTRWRATKQAVEEFMDGEEAEG